MKKNKDTIILVVVGVLSCISFLGIGYYVDFNGLSGIKLFFAIFSFLILDTYSIVGYWTILGRLDKNIKRESKNNE